MDEIDKQLRAEMKTFLEEKIVIQAEIKAAGERDKACDQRFEGNCLRLKTRYMDAGLNVDEAQKRLKEVIDKTSATDLGIDVERLNG
ncbi:Hypothetical protein NGAL_HAMBI2605_59320 [Neorhizobium galegae bv. orientalis]|nr:Hypothetical protein NGAL_HAMBI2605_59320 [Neorhizobium galegae bv. orientalis]